MSEADGGQLTTHVVRLARTLRAAGLPVGTGRVLSAVEAASAIDLSRRVDLYWALHATLVSRVEHHALFDEAFAQVFRGPQDLPAGLELLLPHSGMPPPERRPPTRRIAEALSTPRTGKVVAPDQRVEIDAVLAWSDREQLRAKDFEQMSAAEVREAEAAIARLRLPLGEVPTRRRVPDRRGRRLDPRATLRATLRAGPGALELRWRSPASRPPAVVALCDVSGSMARYSRMLLRFLHALTTDRERVHTFTFGTRLTNVTRCLRHRDVDAALSAVGRTTSDWEGGTRIGACLREFNLRWARRLLGQGAVVLLVTDGLDREDARGLGEEAARLRRSCRRLVWLNPLLRYDAFEPRAAGVRALLPHVDDFRPVHSLDSLAALAAALTDAGRRPSRQRAPSARPTAPG